MSKYYMDCEFLEGTQKERFPISLFRKETPNTIDLISIGIVSEDTHHKNFSDGEYIRLPKGARLKKGIVSREYYAISKDFNLKEAWNRYDLKINKHYPMGGEYVKEYWIRQNVLRPIFEELLHKDYPNTKITNDKFSYKNLKYLINKYGKTNKQIAEEIIQFCSPEIKRYNEFGEYTLSKPEFYAYYADYDWVAFCWLFGKMIDLPKGFPMYCRDLKQEFDSICKRFIEQSHNDKKTFTVHPNETIETLQKQFKTRANYPKQENEHNALSDARWNKQLHNFLKSI